MTVRSADIAIVGGGLIGMMSAYYLTKAGYTVTVFDKSGVATESTWAGGGILSPLYPWLYADEINLLARHSQKCYPELINEIQGLSGISAEYVRSGLLVDSDDIDIKGWNWVKTSATKNENYNNGGKCSSNINPEKNYVLFPEIAQVRNPCLAQSLLSALRNLKVEFVIDTEIIGFSSPQENKISLKTSSGNFEAKKLVVAAGAWSAKLLQNLGLTVDIRPIRGQMLLFKAVPGLIKHILLAKGHYIIPRSDGRILVGSTMENVGFDKTTTQQAKNTLIEFVGEYAPELLQFDIEKHWSGLRPGSPRGIPLICSLPEMNNVFINTGHFRNGVVLAPASAELLADLIQGRQSFVEPEKYNYDNFSKSTFES